MAITKKGLASAELMTTVAIVAIVASFAIPNMMKTRMTANETSAIGNLRALMSAQTNYMNRYGVYADLHELFAERLIGVTLANGVKSGYRFGELDTGSRFTYSFCATPSADGADDGKEYCVTHAGTIYEADFDTSGMMVLGTRWTPGKDCVPEQFTLHPEAHRDVWTAVRQ